ncbi:hypothetical protein N7456_011877 [Penicillium angulare]|uniref:polynucleotide adenylyltransferase n=1 Tax=Penicillium angulare TaxID=116970 RepID=A0A9W9K0K7_9EURO|nr:hypothetical protein N7456_011877 [Penicillium angulare]
MMAPPAPPFQFRGNAPSNDRGRGPPRDRRPRPRHDFTFRFPKPPTSERPLLTTKRETTPEQLRPEDNVNAAPKFASLDALSDSEEAEMDFSDDSDEEARPRKKRALGLDGEGPSAAPAVAPTPKWSNPDPYTALPPPDEGQHKRVDFVRLIRKARLENAGEKKQNDAVVDNQDFISLGPIEGPPGSNGQTFIEEQKAPENAPKGPRGMEIRGTAGTKRGRDEQPRVIKTKLGKPQRRFNSNGSILSDWRPLSGQDPTPWMASTPRSLNPITKLHNEVIAFYNWVRPHRFEQLVRSDLVFRLERAFQSRYGKVQIRPFGSFASGLYLPVADIDLVLLSTSFQNSGTKFYGERKGQIYSFAAFLRDLGIAAPGSVETIAHARVPILKFVDNLTGLRVDLSFDNDSGLLANRTFQEWKSQYPTMPVIVSVIKQFLLIRGLNEVPTGGLGGFSITCLVTHLLQHMPHHNQQNVGDTLLNFFNFYGNEFNHRDVGLRMNAPGFVNKYFGQKERLMIEDPNNPSNDISGGTKEIPLIFRAFSDAYRALKNRLDASSRTPSTHSSLLEAIISANFDEYVEQRYQLREVYETAEQFAQYRDIPPPPPPLPAGSPPPPPPQP